jgi:hypothetical protein
MGVTFHDEDTGNRIVLTVVGGGKWCKGKGVDNVGLED